MIELITNNPKTWVAIYFVCIYLGFSLIHISKGLQCKDKGVNIDMVA